MRQRGSMLELARLVRAEMEAATPFSFDMKIQSDTDNFGLWLLNRCTYRDRSWGGVGILHLDYARWCAQHGQPIPIARRVFQSLLTAEGFWLEESPIYGPLIYGLLLKNDLACYEIIPESRDDPG
jgi:hypothetical protein